MTGTRGVTLLETLVASVLLLLVSGVAYSVMLLVSRSQALASDRASVLINAEVGLERIRRDLQETSLASLACAREPVSLCFLTARDRQNRFQTDQEGKPVWTAIILYYVDPSEKVLRRRRIDSDKPLSPRKLNSLCDGSGSLVAYDVTHLAVETQGCRISLEVTCEASRSGRSNGVRLATVLPVQP